ncbi:uncharacterized protein LOC130901016 [Diorhabda carinulata]|uniref:uncharacterized protein LOC130901016 n=1 Tax=Diorhabda carinulata TaxID=1163345 RepID=UPI0025A2CCA5|nr:uncharacterized protein LOC130901016 [Diorhabda carinulata]
MIPMNHQIPFFFAGSMCESENDTCSSRDLDFNVNSPNENLLFNDATLYNHLTSYSSNVPPNDLFSNEPPPSDLHSKLSNWAASRYVRRTVVTHLLHYLHHLKSLVQSPNKPLQQINRRLKEIEMTVYEKHDSTSPDDEHFCKCELSHFLGPTPNFSCKQYKKLHYKDFIFSIASYSEANCFCLTLEGLVFKIENVVDNNGAVFILGRRFQDYRSFYKYPVDSKEFIQNLSEYIELLHCHKVFSKCIVFPFKQEWLSFSLLHH